MTPRSRSARKTKPVPHCWADGPLTDDGMATTCMRIDGHGGPHEWTRDNDIVLTFPKPVITPAPAPKRRRK